MRELKILIQIDFLALLSALSGRKGKKKNFGAGGALLLIAFLAIYISGIYSFTLGEMFSEYGIFRYFLPVMALMAVGISLLFTLFAAKGIVFGSKDVDFMLSLPVSSFKVMLAKLTSLYLENFLFIALWMIPTAIAQAAYGGINGMFFVTILLSVVCLTFVTSFFSALCGYLMAFVEGRLRLKAIFFNLISVLLFGVYLVVIMQITRIPQMILENEAAADRLFHSWLLSIGLLMDMSEGSFLAAILFLLICSLPYMGIAWLFSFQYKKILSSLAAKNLRTDYRVKKITASGAFAAILKKEAGKFFGTSTYFLNAGISLLMLLGGCGYLIVTKEKYQDLFLGFGESNLAAPICLAVMIALLGMSYPTAVSISLEGKTLWILKEAPLTPQTIYGAKAALGIVLTWPMAFLCIGIMTWIFALPVWTVLVLLLAVLSYTAMTSVGGVWLNMKFPKMDCPNEAIVVKQSLPAMVACFGGMFLGLIAGVLWLLTYSFLPFEVYGLILTALFGGLTFWAWNWLIKKGPEVLKSL